MALKSFNDIPDNVADRARVVIQMALNTDAIHAADILAPWVAQSPELFVQVMLAIARMADPDRLLKDAHSAYGRGVRTDVVVQLEREYQRRRVRKGRRVERELAAQDDDASTKGEVG